MPTIELQEFSTATTFYIKAASAEEAQAIFDKFVDAHNSGHCLLEGAGSIQIEDDNTSVEGPFAEEDDDA